MRSRARRQRCRTAGPAELLYTSCRAPNRAPRKARPPMELCSRSHAPRGSPALADDAGPAPPPPDEHEEEEEGEGEEQAPPLPAVVPTNSVIATPWLLTLWTSLAVPVSSLICCIRLKSMV
ncbi:unnamed protein product, partial [Ixodes pacificus]